MTNRPRQIKGSVGDRIRIVLNETGSQFVLLLNEDDGNHERQRVGWTEIPDALAEQLNNSVNGQEHLTEIDFGSTGAWYVHGRNRNGAGGVHARWGQTHNGDLIDAFAKSSDMQNFKVSFGSDKYGLESFVAIEGTTKYRSSNIDDRLAFRLKRMQRSNKKIHSVRLFSNGAYFVADDEGVEWKGVGYDCDDNLDECIGRRICDVAIAEDGSWIIIGARSLP